MKSLCMIGTFPPPINGLSIAFETLAEADELKKEFDIYKVNYAVKNQFTGVKEILYKVYFNIALICKFKRLILSRKFDIFYLNLSTTKRGSNRDILLIGMIKKYAPYAKLVLHHHGGSFQNFYEGCSSWRKRRVEGYLDDADKVIVLTKKLKHMFDNVVSDSKICIVSNGIKDENRINNELLEKKFVDIKEKIVIDILYLSNLIRGKGYIQLLEAANILNENMQVQIMFAGEFESNKEKKNFYEYIKRYQLENIVTYKGVVKGESKKELLEKADIFVLPTMLHEGQPISILEAMAAGMSIITTKQGGITDVVQDGVNGIILRATTPTCIADAIISLIDNRELMEHMGRNNVKEVNEKYLEKYYINNMVNIFQEVSDNGEELFAKY